MLSWITSKITTPLGSRRSLPRAPAPRRRFLRRPHRHLGFAHIGGTLKSVREYCGIEREYVEHLEEAIDRRYITINPTSTSTAPVLMPDMEGFVIGEKLRLDTNSIHYNSTVNQYVHVGHTVDGKITPETFYTGQSTAGLELTVSIHSRAEMPCGLHKVETRWSVNANTATSAKRYLTVSVK